MEQATSLLQQEIFMYCFELMLEDETLCYIDGHAKHFWQSNNIPRLFSYIMMDIKTSLAKQLITPSKDAPPVRLTAPTRDTKLRQLMTNLVNAIHKSTGKRVIEAAVFNRQRVLLTIFMAFDRFQEDFLCPLKEGEYTGIKDFEMYGDFQLLRKYDPDIPALSLESEGDRNIEDSRDVLEWVAEARFILTNKERDIAYRPRAALLLIFAGGKVKLIPVITNISQDAEPDISRIAVRYLNARPHHQEESIFLYLMEAIKANERLATATMKSSDESSKTPKK